MNRLVVRLVTSHVLVAVLSAAATFLVVRQLAPALFDESMQRQPQGPGWGQGQSRALREQFAESVDQALLVGALIGAAAAAIFGAWAAYALIRPIGRLQSATREMAKGRYAVPVAVPRERELADLVTDVNTLGEALATTEARRVRLLGEVAHEMRTPLTVIDGYVEGMIDGVIQTSPVELGQVSEEVRRLRRLSENLSALSRSEEGRLELHVRRVDLRDLAAGATERLRPQAEDAELDLVVEPGTTRLPVDVDVDHIAQVVTNLVGNALRATTAGGRVTVSCRADGTTAVLAVSDTGEGLAHDDLERVFERFYRVPGRRRGEHDTGSGIGLTIARGIVRTHGGDIAAESPGIGQGATFTVRLPLAA
jgi:histidine kinase